MHSCEETPYITRIQWPFDTSQTLTVLSIDDEAMYWLLDEKSKSVNKLALERQSFTSMQRNCNKPRIPDYVWMRKTIKP